MLRRLLRRAARHGKLLGVNDPFLYQVCDTVIHENEGHYPELRERQDYITKVIRVEEENFAKTIDGGLKIFHDMLEEHQSKGEKTFSGADAFKLYDTYGFPMDLTLEMVEEQGMALDEAEFHKQMDEQRRRARKAREALGDLGWAGVEFGKEIPETQFVGYDTLTVSDARVVAIVVENEQAEELMPGVEAIVVLDKTPFYAEMGGQTADHGTLCAGGAVFQVTDVQKNKGGKYMHSGKLTGGVDVYKRQPTDCVPHPSWGIHRERSRHSARGQSHPPRNGPEQSPGSPPAPPDGTDPPGLSVPPASHSGRLR